ncbi:hypothetical protein DFJ74DRAFT_702104 [Hyaloraphidium curvatum]|nr:hypothetical protein DFJ74DRAFT_702104 [Hyaloraphidium curvatum]
MRAAELSLAVVEFVEALDDEQGMDTLPPDRPARLRTSCSNCTAARKRCEPAADGGPCGRCLRNGLECTRAPSLKRGPKGPWGARGVSVESWDEDEEPDGDEEWGPRASRGTRSRPKPEKTKGEEGDEGARTTAGPPQRRKSDAPAAGEPERKRRASAVSLPALLPSPGSSASSGAFAMVFGSSMFGSSGMLSAATASTSGNLQPLFPTPAPSGLLALPGTPASLSSPSETAGVPRWSSLPFLPDPPTFYYCTAQLYVPRTAPGNGLLRRAEILRPDAPVLTLCSVLLATLAVARDDTPPPVVTLERQLFDRATEEVAALLDSSTRPTIHAFSSLVDLGMWCAHKGLHGLARKLDALSDALLVRAGHVAKDMQPALPATWEDAASAAFGPGVLDAEIGQGGLRALKEHWINYFAAQRLVHLRLRVRMEREFRDKGQPAGSLATDLSSLSLPAVPGPRVWEAAELPSFDPRRMPKTPATGELLACLLLDRGDLRRAGLRVLGGYLAQSGEVLLWLSVLLRRELDRFIRACTAAGLASPAQLPTDASACSPELRPLLARRTQLDSLIADVRDHAFPPAARIACATGDPAQLLAANPDARALLPCFATIPVLRLQLHTSLGTMPRPDPGVPSSLDAEPPDALADEVASGEGGAELLDCALAFARLMSSLSSDPGHPVAPSPAPYLALFSVLRLFAPLAKRLRSSPAPAAEEALEEVMRAARGCIMALDARGRCDAFARKMADRGRAMMGMAGNGGTEGGGGWEEEAAARLEEVLDAEPV